MSWINENVLAFGKNIRNEADYKQHSLKKEILNCQTLLNSIDFQNRNNQNSVERNREKKKGNDSIT
jgi:hypothetical protein